MTGIAGGLQAAGVVAGLAAGAAGGYAAYRLNESTWKLTGDPDAVVGVAFAYLIGGGIALACAKGAGLAATGIATAPGLGGKLGAAAWVGAALVGAAGIAMLPGLVTSTYGRGVAEQG